MKLIQKINDLKKETALIKSQNKTIGLVPTMGFLHEGHLSLVKASRKNNDITIMSIFVNPTQFGPNEDFDRYPRNLERDMEMAEANGVNIVFIPEVIEMYPDKFGTFVSVGEITSVLCGKSRPGHFNGVTTVVNKLFNLVEPDRAYFGQKDAQQVAVINKMVLDLNMNVEIVTCPIIREADGLAMSSRNVYLSPEERKSALVLSKSLFMIKDMFEKGERNCSILSKTVKNMIAADKSITLDYMEIVDPCELSALSFIEKKALAAIAVRIGKTRLIDNILLEVK